MNILNVLNKKNKQEKPPKGVEIETIWGITDDCHTIEIHHKDPKKQKEMAEYLVSHWDFFHCDRPFDGIYGVAKKYSLVPELVERVKNFVNSKEFEDMVNSRDEEKFKEIRDLYYVADFLLGNKLQQEYEKVEEAYIVRLAFIPTKTHQLVKKYAELVDKYHIRVNEKIYEQVINGRDSFSYLYECLEKYPDALDYRRIFLGKIAKLIDDDNLYAHDCISKCYHAELFTTEEIGALVDQARKKPSILEEFIQRGELDVFLKPEEMEQYVLEHKCYDCAIQVAKKEGVDAKKIEQMVLDKKDFWLSYEYAMTVESADKQKHLEVMMNNMPSVYVKKVGYGHAYAALRKSEHINLEIYGDSSPLITSKAAVEIARAKMQSAEERKANDEKDRILDAIKTLSKEINQQSEKKEKEINKQSEKKEAEPVKKEAIFGE